MWRLIYSLYFVHPLKWGEKLKGLRQAHSFRHIQDQINFKVLMSYLMFLSSALQIYTELYGIIYISS